MAGEIWQKFGKNQTSIEILFSQMWLYKLNELPYDMSYIALRDTSKIWWLAIDNIDDLL